MDAEAVGLATPPTSLLVKAEAKPQAKPQEVAQPLVRNLVAAEADEELGPLPVELALDDEDEDDGTLPPLAPEFWPNVDHLITEDDTPVDNIFSEKQQRLSTGSFYASYPSLAPGRDFVSLANVALYSGINAKAQVPDVMVSLNVKLPADIWEKRHRSYFIWEFNKSPEVVIETVSNKKGGETSNKLTQYAELHIPYYVVFDPIQQLSQQALRVYRLNGATYVEQAAAWFPELGVGLTLWQGKFEDREDRWLRWVDGQGNLLLTGEERAEQADQRAELADQRAEQAGQRAEAEQTARQQAEEKLQRLAAQLRALGIEPE